MQGKVNLSLLGLSLAVMGRVQTCWPLYALRAFIQADPELSPRLSVTLHDLPLGLPDDEVCAAVTAARPDVLGMSCYVWNSPRMLRLAERLRREVPGALLILGGPDADFRAPALLRANPCLDGIVRGEGEEPLRLVLRRLAGLDPAPWGETPGLAVRSGEGLKFHPPPDPLPMERLPFFHLAPELDRGGPRTMILEVARGCRRRCVYCGYGAQSLGKRTRPLRQIVRALRAFSAGGGGVVALLDPGMNQDRRRFRAILRHVAACGNLKVKGLELNPDRLGPDDVPWLSRVVDGPVSLGLQSTQPAALQAVGRWYRKRAFRDLLASLREAGLYVSVDMIVGLPGDDLDGFRRSMDDVFAFFPNYVCFYPLQVLPGSRLPDLAERWDLRYQENPPYQLLSTATFSARDLGTAHRLVKAAEIFTRSSGFMEGIPLVCRELGVSPSILLAEFLAGDGRRSPLTDPELEHLLSPDGHEEGQLRLLAYLDGQFRRRKGESMPGPLRELFEFLHGYGALRLMASGCGAAAMPAGTPPPDRAPKLRSTVRLMCPASDVLALLKRLPPLAEVRDRPVRLLLFIQDRTASLACLSEAAARLVEAIDGRRTREELETIVSDRALESGAAFDRRQAAAILQELTHRQVLAWPEAEG